MASFFGEPPQSTIHQAPGGQADPGFAFAKWLFGQLPGMFQQDFPQYPGSLDPGLSPSLQDLLRRAQGFAGSSPHEIFSGVQGSLGRFMNPQFQNPITRLFGGAPDYFGVDPNQRIYGGQPAGGMTYQTGMGGPFAQGAQPATNQVGWPTMQSMATPTSAAAAPSRMQRYQEASARQRVFAPGADGQLQWQSINPSWVGSTDPAVFNSPEFLKMNQGMQHQGLHTADYGSALERIHGRPVSKQERMEAWRRGDSGVIDEARKLFMQDSPPQFTGTNQRLHELVTQHGVGQGTRLFDQEMAGR